MGKKSKRSRPKGTANQNSSTTAAATGNPSAAYSNAAHPLHHLLALHNPPPQARPTTTATTPLKVHPWSEENADSPWLRHDERLLGDPEREAAEEAIVTRSNALDATKVLHDDPPPSNPPKGSAAFLEMEVEEYLGREHGRGGSLARAEITFGPEGGEEWAAWASSLLLHPLRVCSVSDDFYKDIALHNDVLRRMQSLSEGTLGQSLTSVNNAGLHHLRMMNTMVCDVFARLSLPLPPNLDLTSAYGCGHHTRTEGQHLYTWYDKLASSYVGVVFNVVKMVVEQVLEHPPDKLVTKMQGDALPAVVKSVFRGPFVALKDQVRQSILYRDWMVDDMDEDDTDRKLTQGDLDRREEDFHGEGGDDDGGFSGFSSGDVEELGAQGMKPWDNDAHSVLASMNGMDGEVKKYLDGGDYAGHAAKFAAQGLGDEVNDLFGALGGSSDDWFKAVGKLQNAVESKNRK